MTQQLLLVAQLHLLHHINFSFLILVGNLLLLPILLVLWKVYFREEKGLRRRLILFLPIPWIFFAMNYAETVDFAISGLQVLGVILLSVLALELLGRSMEEEGWSHFVPAMLVAGLACLTYANGFLLAPVGLLVLVLRRRYRRAVIWCAAFVVPLVPFLYRYHSTSHFAVKDLPWTPLFFLSFLGSAVFFLPLCLAVGAGIVIVYGLAVRNRYDRENPAAFMIATWILVNGAVVTFARVGIGLWSSHSSRYRIYSDLLLIFCYGYVAPRVARRAMTRERTRRLYRFTLTAAVLFCVMADVYGCMFFKRRREELMIGMTQYKANPAVNSPMYFVLPGNESANAAGEEAARVILNRAIAAGVYVPEGSPGR